MVKEQRVAERLGKRAGRREGKEEREGKEIKMGIERARNVKM